MKNSEKNSAMKEFINAFTAYAKSNGVGRLEYYAEEQHQHSLHVYRGELEKTELSHMRRLFVEAETEGYYGSLFIEDFSPELFSEHVRLLKESAKVRKKTFIPYTFPEGAEENLQNGNEPLPASLLTEALIKAEKAAYEADEAVKEVQSCVYREEQKQLLLMNDRGQCLQDSVDSADFYISLEAREDGVVQMGYAGTPFVYGTLPDTEAMAHKAALDAAAMLNARSYPTGRYKVLLSAQVVCELLNAFAPAFSAKHVQSHTSALEGKLHSSVAAENIVLKECPQMEGGLCRRCFDDERVATKETVLIADGKLQSLLYNRESANKDGCDSTGNGFIGDFGSEASTGFTNLVLESGSATVEELQRRMDKGLYITGLSGVFAGASASTGNFSLLARGYAVENGKIQRGVNQITIAGSFTELLENAEALSCETAWMHGNEGYLYAPAMLIRSLTVSGSEK